MKKNIDNNVKKTEQNSARRTFIKKAVYVAPTLMALGSLTRPKDAKAGFTAPPSAPDWG